MTINELKKLIEAGDVNEIVIFSMYSELHNPAYKALTGSLYTIHAYDYDEQNTVARFGNKLMNSSRDAQEKTYTSIDRAYAAIRKLGWHSMIKIDG
jgi:hypothetical protein